MKTYWKIVLIASLFFVLIALSTSIFAFERIPDSELATLYGGYFYCDQDCQDATDGCPKEISEFGAGSPNCDTGCPSGSPLDDCVGGCPETSDEECGNWHTQVLPGKDCNDTVPDVTCQSGTGTYHGWCNNGACQVVGGAAGTVNCSDCTREDCADE